MWWRPLDNWDHNLGQKLPRIMATGGSKACLGFMVKCITDGVGGCAAVWKGIWPQPQELAHVQNQLPLLMPLPAVPWAPAPGRPSHGLLSLHRDPSAAHLSTASPWLSHQEQSRCPPPQQPHLLSCRALRKPGPVTVPNSCILLGFHTCYYPTRPNG